MKSLIIILLLLCVGDCCRYDIFRNIITIQFDKNVLIYYDVGTVESLQNK